MFRFNPGKAGKVFPPKHPYYKAPAEAKKTINNILMAIIVTPKSDKPTFRNIQAEARQTMKQSSPAFFSGSRYYSKRLYYGNNQKDSIVAHCFTSTEIEAAKHLESILPTLNGGIYQPIDMSRVNYKRKQQDGVLHFTVYEFEYNGKTFELKCEAIKKRGWKYVEEQPYSLKEK